jgi:ribosomal protein S18 acetylase RimI-like enzyme
MPIMTTQTQVDQDAMASRDSLHTERRRRAGEGRRPQPVPEPTLRRVRIRRAVEHDLAQVADIDHRVTKIAKPEFWDDIFERYGKRRLTERFFLVAEPEDGGAILGFVVGEVRAWEFGSEPCGWLFAISVDPKARQQHVGEQLFEALADSFRKAGVAIMRTMVSRDSPQTMAFFRGEGMMAGRYFQLEKSLD